MCPVYPVTHLPGCNLSRSRISFAEAPQKVPSYRSPLSDRAAASLAIARFTSSRRNPLARRGPTRIPRLWGTPTGAYHRRPTTPEGGTSMTREAAADAPPVIREGFPYLHVRGAAAAYEIPAPTA